VGQVPLRRQGPGADSGGGDVGGEEWTEVDFARAGRLYIPIKKDIHIRLDADVIEWLKRNGKGYQTRANEILRRAMLADI
jgi:uncharacterized protein (DUF4415 family)